MCGDWRDGWYVQQKVKGDRGALEGWMGGEMGGTFNRKGVQRK